MKRCFIFALTIILLAVSFGGIADDEPAYISELLDHVSGLLEAREALAAIQTNVYQAVRAFVANNDYDSLMIARAACSQAIQDMKAFDVPKMQMSKEAILYFFKQGVEIDGLEAEFFYLRREVNSVLEEAEKLEASLYTDVYHISTIPQLAELAASAKKILDQNTLTDSYAIDHLLSPLTKDEQVQWFMSEIGSELSVLLSGTAENMDDMIRINLSGEAGQYPSDLFSQKVITADMSEQLEEIAAASGNQNAVRNDINVIRGMPTMIAAPDWPDGTNIIVQAANPDYAGAGIPSLLARAFQSVSVDDFKAYYETLKMAGVVDTPLLGDDETGWSASCELNGYSFSIRWQPDGTAFIEYNPSGITLEAGWYSQYQ